MSQNNSKQTAKDKKILIVDKGHDIQELISMYVESDFNTPMITIKELKEVFEKITSDQTISLLIADYDADNTIPIAIFNFLVEKNLKMPFIIISAKNGSEIKELENFVSYNKGNSFLKRPFTVEDVVTVVSHSIGIKRHSTVEGYRRIRAEKIEYYVQENIPLYILDHENNYVQIDASDTERLIGEVKNLVLAGEEFFYMTFDDYQTFSDTVVQKLKDKMLAPKTNMLERFQLQFSSIENIHQSLQALGLGTREIELGAAVTDTTLKVLNSNNKTSKILGKLIKNRDYKYELAMLSSYMSTAMAHHVDWTTSASYQKLSMAAIFQDLSLADIDHVKIVSVKSEEFLKLSEKDKILVKNHPEESCKLLDGFSEIEDIVGDIKNIIMQHHERPDRSGFPKGIGSNTIFPLGCIFIIAHEFCHRLIEKPLTKATLEKVVVDFSQHFTHGNFRKPYNAFLDSFKNKLNSRGLHPSKK